jgi:hypothetical protein
VNIFALELFDDEGGACTFYTVRWLEDELSETEKFFANASQNSELLEKLEELTTFLLDKIADQVGAREFFFRSENYAQALPPSGKHVINPNTAQAITINYSNFPLRLYCLRISDQLVVLFNGGEKTSQTAQGGNTAGAFREANNFAKRIVEAIKDKEITITSNGRELSFWMPNTEITL